MSDVFPPDVSAYFKKHNYGKTALEITEELNRRFCANYKLSQIKAFRKNHHLISGFTGRYEKGHVPANKGKKGVYGKDREKSWFGKGHRPHNWCPVGTERLATIGYIKVKIAEPNVWKFKHILIWEEHNGKVPAGSLISFKDGNRFNFDINNLMCITRAEHGIMNNNGFRSENPEITETYATLAKVMHKTRQRIKQ